MADAAEVAQSAPEGRLNAEEEEPNDDAQAAAAAAAGASANGGDEGEHAPAASVDERQEQAEEEEEEGGDFEEEEEEVTAAGGAGGGAGSAAGHVDDHVVDASSERPVSEAPPPLEQCEIFCSLVVAAPAASPCCVFLSPGGSAPGSLWQHVCSRGCAHACTWWLFVGLTAAPARRRSPSFR